MKTPIERDLFYINQETSEFSLLLKPMESLNLPFKFDLFIPRTDAVDGPNFTDPFNVKVYFIYL